MWLLGAAWQRGFPEKGHPFLLPDADSNLSGSLVAAEAKDGRFSTIQNPLFSYLLKCMNSWLAGRAELLQQSFLSRGGFTGSFHHSDRVSHLISSYCFPFGSVAFGQSHKRINTA